MKPIWMILLSVLISAGCYGNPFSPHTGAGEPTTVPVASAAETNAMVNIRFDEVVSHDGLKLGWLEISDSRCPTGVNCVWAGEVKVTLEVTNTLAEGGEPVEVRLTLQARQGPATASVFGYELELLNVDPYPKDQVTTARGHYVAVIKVSEAAQTQ